MCVWVQERARRKDERNGEVTLITLMEVTAKVITVTIEIQARALLSRPGAGRGGAGITYLWPR